MTYRHAANYLPPRKPYRQYFIRLYSITKGPMMIAQYDDIKERFMVLNPKFSEREYPDNNDVYWIDESKL